MRDRQNCQNTELVRRNSVTIRHHTTPETQLFSRGGVLVFPGEVLDVPDEVRANDSDHHDGDADVERPVQPGGDGGGWEPRSDPPQPAQYRQDIVTSMASTTAISIFGKLQFCPRR